MGMDKDDSHYIHGLPVSNTMHSGLKGNVLMYRLDVCQIADMIDRKIFPPPERILSATIGIMFVGPQGLQESVMPPMFSNNSSWAKEKSTVHG